MFGIGWGEVVTVLPLLAFVALIVVLSIGISRGVNLNGDIEVSGDFDSVDRQIQAALSRLRGPQVNFAGEGWWVVRRPGSSWVLLMLAFLVCLPVGLVMLVFYREERALNVVLLERRGTLMIRISGNATEQDWKAIKHELSYAIKVDLETQPEY